MTRIRIDRNRQRPVSPNDKNNSDGEHLQEILKEAGFTKDDVDQVNEGQITKSLLHKFTCLLQCNNNKLVLFTTRLQPELKWDDAALIVFSVALDRYITAQFRKKGQKNASKD